MGPSPQINSPCGCVAAAAGKQGKKVTRCAGRWSGLDFGDPSGLLATWNILWWELRGVEGRDMSQVALRGVLGLGQVELSPFRTT